MKSRFAILFLLVNAVIFAGCHFNLHTSEPSTFRMLHGYNQRVIFSSPNAPFERVFLHTLMQDRSNYVARKTTGVTSVSAEATVFGHSIEELNTFSSATYTIIDSADLHIFLGGHDIHCSYHSTLQNRGRSGIENLWDVTSGACIHSLRIAVPEDFQGQIYLNGHLVRTRN